MSGGLLSAVPTAIDPWGRGNQRSGLVRPPRRKGGGAYALPLSFSGWSGCQQAGRPHISQQSVELCQQSVLRGIRHRSSRGDLTCRTGGASWSRGTRRTRRACGTCRTGGTGRTRRTHRACRTCRAGSAGYTRRTHWSRRTHRAGKSWQPHGAGRTRQAPRTSRTGRARNAANAAAFTRTAVASARVMLIAIISHREISSLYHSRRVCRLRLDRAPQRPDL